MCWCTRARTDVCSVAKCCIMKRFKVISINPYVLKPNATYRTTELLSDRPSPFPRPLSLRFTNFKFARLRMTSREKFKIGWLWPFATSWYTFWDSALRFFNKCEPDLKNPKVPLRFPNFCGRRAKSQSTSRWHCSVLTSITKVTAHCTHTPFKHWQPRRTNICGSLTCPT